MNKGKIVKRKSYGEDVSFKILHVYPHERLAILQSIAEEKIFFADAHIDDLVEVE